MSTPFLLRFSPFVLALSVTMAACAPARVALDPEPPATVSTCDVPLAQAMEMVDAASRVWWQLDKEEDCIRGIGIERAYREILRDRQPARTVIVAVIDSGIDIEHEDLRAAIWRNEGEVAGTGADDDGNGYPDDIHGWNFIGGPDGRHVVYDTYEAARLYARLLPRFEGVNPETLSGADREEYLLFLQVEADLQEKQAETADLLAQLQQIDAVVRHIEALLRDYLGTDTLDMADVRAIRTTRRDIIQARDIMIELDEYGLTAEVIARELEQTEGRLQYSLDPGFDPRPIVRDNYDDPWERIYGNPDVFGPFAEHGTHVAGIIAAERGNERGIDGIAPALIMPVRAVPNGDERDKDVANAIRYAVDNGAHIINMSFGKSYSPEKFVVDAAVRYAEERGVLLVHAAGNSAEDLREEANYPSRFLDDGAEASLWLEVGASSWWAADSMAAPFTNYGRGMVDLFAPGVDILSTTPGDRYEKNSGTSMAAPVVSGVAALLMAYYPELTAAQVRRIILDSTRRYDGRQVVLPGGDGALIDFSELATTAGVLDAYAAVRMAEEMVAAGVE
jgi:subtilisin family serine protease